jgi:hypothetical protein
MARYDIAGMFWDDTPPPKPPKKEKPVRVKPDPVWLLPTYLPGLEEARSWRPNLFSDQELIEAWRAGERLVWDIECYPNYFCVAFEGVSSGKQLVFDMLAGGQLDRAKLYWVLMNFIIVDFNGRNYDAPIVSLAVAGFDTEKLFNATHRIIEKRERPYEVLKSYKIKQLDINHIDLIELVALRPSLKLLAGRLHAPKMQDLPFAPGSVLSDDQIVITRWYCANDLRNTILLYKELLPDIQLRESMTAQYGVDLRSKSDAQIAEAVLSHEIKRATGARKLERPTIPPGTAYRYNIPAFIKYQTPLMNRVLDLVRESWFVVSEKGSVKMPAQLNALKIEIAGSVYRMGIGGLHSSEKKMHHEAEEGWVLEDRDMTAYYPSMILNLGLAPSHLGMPFLTNYRQIVDRRVAAKAAGDKVVDKALKIVINGSFGKLGSKWSVFYSPDLLIQVTITGQLTLLMLIERLELAGISVVSANTDGIVTKYPEIDRPLMESIVAKFEQDTGFNTESTFYKSIFCRDVNNYFALKKYEDKKTKQWLDEFPEGTKTADKIKVKGIFAERGSSRDTILSKNPTIQICTDAVMATLVDGIPVRQTIEACKDLRRFFMVRTVRGGAVKDGQYLGKAIRWYYAKGIEGEIVYAMSGNAVPRSEGAKPCMQMPDEFPDDINYEFYVSEAEKILTQIGYIDRAVEEDEEEDIFDDAEDKAEDEFTYDGA